MDTVEKTDFFSVTEESVGFNISKAHKQIL